MLLLVYGRSVVHARAGTKLKMRCRSERTRRKATKDRGTREVAVAVAGKIRIQQTAKDEPNESK